MCRAAARLSRAVGICRESGGGAPQSQRKRPRPLRPGPVSPLLPPRKTMRTNPMLGGRPETWSAASVPQSVKAAVSPIWLQLACQLVDAGVEIGVARAYTPQTPQCRCRVAPGGATHGELAAVAQQGRIDAGGRRLPRRHCRGRLQQHERSVPVRLGASRGARVRACRRHLGPQQGRQRHLRGVEAVRVGPLPRGGHQPRRHPDAGGVRSAHAPRQAVRDRRHELLRRQCRRAPEPQRDGRQAQPRLCAARQERRLRDRRPTSACSP